jgi:hypothetical protein
MPPDQRVFVASAHADTVSAVRSQYCTAAAAPVLVPSKHAGGQVALIILACCVTMQPTANRGMKSYASQSCQGSSARLSGNLPACLLEVAPSLATHHSVTQPALITMQ